MTSPAELEAAEEEVRLVYDEYERAVQQNDAETLISLFWDSPKTVRAAPNGFLVGAAEIAAFRRARPAADYRRVEKRLEVTALTSDVVMAALVSERTGTTGFQTQTWLRTPDGWRVAMGHVSQFADEGDSPPPGVTSIQSGSGRTS